MLNAPAADRTPNKVSAKETLPCNTHSGNADTGAECALASTRMHNYANTVVSAIFEITSRDLTTASASVAANSALIWASSNSNHSSSRH